MKGDVYHILNRGVDKRKVFLGDQDYLRFVHNLYDFNNKNETFMSYRNRRKSECSAILKPNSDDRLVDVLCWCLMPNHYHILVREWRDSGAGLFSKKINSGYTQYFNLKNERSGVLFQGKSKIIPVNRDNYFMYLPFYIFANPVQLIEKNWKENGIKNSKQVIKFLENYKWSSYSDIIGGNTFSFITSQDKFFELFIADKKQFKKDFLEWLVGYRIAEQ